MTAFKTLLVAAGILILGFTGVHGAEVTSANIQLLKPPITLKLVKSMFGNFENGHGPYVWYKSVEDPGKEYWFWFLPQREGSAFEDLQVTFISIVAADDPDKFEVVWPKELIDINKRDVFILFYEGLPPR